MTIDKVIKHCEEVAEKLEENAKEGRLQLESWDYITECEKRASDHRQLAAWLIVLKEIWDSGGCNDCRNGQCEWRPKLGQLVRYNCPHYVGVANEEVKADDSN